jgi:uroporphyrinogen III methyltransferase/synthase
VTVSGLRGKRVLITRPEQDSAELRRFLELRGAEVILLPTIAIVDPDSWDDCDRAIINIRKYAGVFFTSKNAVEKFLGRVDAINADARAILARRAVYAVGEKTEAALEVAGIPVAETPEVYSSEALAASFEGRELAGQCFLFPRSDIGRDLVPNSLRELGADVDEIVVYKTVTPKQLEMDSVRESLSRGEIDVVTFFSPSAVRNFLQMMGSKCVEHTPIAVIGPTTEAAANQLGLSAHVVAPAATAESLVDALAQFFNRETTTESPHS